MRSLACIGNFSILPIIRKVMGGVILFPHLLYSEKFVLQFWRCLVTLYAGLFDLSWWGYVLMALLLTHITIVSVTLFLHRAQAHLAIQFGPFLSHFFRCWLWLTTGMVTKEWVAIHRKHHGQCEMEGDPHSPIVWLRGTQSPLLRVLKMIFIWVPWRGVRLYVAESKEIDMVRYGVGTPSDCVERHLYTPYAKYGIVLMLAFDILCFGAMPGLLIWLVQIVWIPVFAAGIVNGVGHYFGYRNFESCHRKTGVVDSSTNIGPFGVLIGGEELHNNHHAHELSPKLSVKWYEFDIGWMYIRFFNFLGLVKSIRSDRMPT